MYPRSTAPRGWSDYNDGMYSPPSVPPYHDYNHQRPEGVNRRYIPHRPHRLPTYHWKPSSSPSPVPPTYTPVMTNGRKRQNNDYSPYTTKRQRFDSPSLQRISSTVTPRLLPPPRPNQVVAGSSRSNLAGFDRSYPIPNFNVHNQLFSVPESANSLKEYAKDKLSDQMLELFEACQQQASDLTKKEIFRTQLQQDIQRLYADARLYLTGSSMNGLGCRSSDADLCLVINGKRRLDALQVLANLQRLFKTLPYVERTQLIKAKVPIIRFKEKGSDLQFDLNVNNTVGIRNTFLLKSYANADLRIRPMILVIKKWARYHHINDASKGTLSSYTLVLMVLHYLQTLDEPVVPSLQMDYPDCFDPFMDIDVVPEGTKRVPPYKSRNHSSLGDLFQGFLRYYTADFRWEQQVISIREARVLPKTNSKEWRNKFICVEEPFERNNVARAVHERVKFDAIKAQFAESCHILHQKRDLDAILPVRAIINSELSRR